MTVESSATSPVAAAASAARSRIDRIQVLVELTDTPTLRVYEAAFAASPAASPAAREAAARAAAQAQEQRIKDAQASLSRAVAELGGRELYRVRRSFNGMSVLVGPDQLAALRELPGVKAVYPRVPATEAGSREVAVHSAESAPAPSHDGSVVAASGMRAYRDPRTGRLTSHPTDAQVRDLERLIGDALSESQEGLEVRTAPDGSKYVDLQGRFQSISVATFDTDSGTRLHCTDRRQGARRLLLDSPASTPVEEE